MPLPFDILLSVVLVALLACALAYLVGARELPELKTGRWPGARAFVSAPAWLTYAAALAGAALAWQFMALPVTTLLLIAATAGLLAAIARLDLETGMLSDLLTLVLGALALGYDALRFAGITDWWPTLALACGLFAFGWLLAGPYSRWRGRDMLGWGDVKFFAAAGLWLSPLQLPTFLIIAGVAGTLGALLYKLTTGRAETPFAPALCCALFACIVFGLALAPLPLD